MIRKVVALALFASVSLFPAVHSVKADEVEVPRETKWEQRKDSNGVEILASCSAYGNPSCSIDCPTGKAAVCTPGGAFPAKCECK